MRRVKTFLSLVLAHLGLTLGAVHLAVYSFVAGITGGGTALVDAAGDVAAMALWVLGSPVLTAAWTVAPGFWSTGPLVALATLNSAVWVGAAVLLARRLHPRRPGLLSGVYVGGVSPRWRQGAAASLRGTPLSCTLPETQPPHLPPGRSRSEADSPHLPQGHMRLSRRAAAPLLALTVAACQSHAPVAIPMPPVLTAPSPMPGAAPVGEEYRRIDENAFRLVTAEPLSTFSIDVDAASYGNVRRFLNDGRLPPPDAVRIEELVNYFDYAYPDPDGEHPFSVTTEVSAAPWNPQHRLVQIGLQGRRISAEALPPANLTFLVDVSGSMMPANRLPLLRRAFRLLVERLREEDRVAIVVYASASGLVLPPTSGAEKGRILAAIDRLEAGGSTAGGAGLRLAYATAREMYRPGAVNRVILATDGDFNVGVRSHAELERMVEEERRHGVAITVLGFGRGNLKDERMERIAQAGDGNYAYIDRIAEARKALVEEMGGTLHTIARDVKLQVEFNPAEVRAYRLIGYENRLLADQDFNDDDRDAGDLGAGHSVTALYEVVPVGVETPVRGVDSLRYQQATPRATAASGELATVKLRYKPPHEEASRLLERAVLDRRVPLDATSPDFRFAAAVAEWGMLLRRSAHAGSASFDQVTQLARGALGDDRNGLRAEFVSLVARSRDLDGERRGDGGAR